MLSWHYVTRAAYDAASAAEKTSDKLFFLSDTKEIYRGTEAFTESVILYTSVPTTPAVGKLYINSTTLEGRVWNGTSWTTVINPVADTVTADGTTAVSGKAVAEFVSEEIAKVTGSSDLVTGVSYTEASKEITVSMADGTEDTVALTGLAVELAYDSTTGALTIKDVNGKTLGTAVNLDLERFVSSASYDDTNKKIVLNFNDESDPIEIPVGDLVDTYTAKNSKSISLTVTGNEFVAEAIVAETAGNMLEVTDAGLYVAATDLSDYYTSEQTDSAISAAVSNFNTNTVAPIASDVADLKSASATHAAKVAGATAGNIATLNADGDLADGGIKAGTSTLGNSASVLATEAAVAAVVSTINSTIATKMTKVGTGHEDEVIIADANGDAAASGKKVGGATFNATPNDVTIATEKGVTNYVEGYAVAKTNVVASGAMATTVAAASDEKVTSEKAIVDMMTWKTTV